MNSRLLLTFIAAAALALPASAQMRNRAVRGCEDNVRQQAINRFGTDDISFQRLNTGRDWVGGMVRIGEPGNVELHHFSCSVNFDNGYVRSARIEGATSSGEASRDVMAGAMDSCRAAVSDRIQDQGYFDVRINSMNLDRDGDRVSGSARAQTQYHPETFSFSCQLDPSSGAVSSVNLMRR